jgi:hypothetical protein
MKYIRAVRDNKILLEVLKLYEKKIEILENKTIELIEKLHDIESDELSDESLETDDNILVIDDFNIKIDNKIKNMSFEELLKQFSNKTDYS